MSLGPGLDHGETPEGINVDGPQNLLELIGELGIPRASTRARSVSTEIRGERIDESPESSELLPGVYFRTKWEVHYEVIKPVMEDGLPMMTVLPSIVFGRYDKEYGSARAAKRDYLWGDLPIIPRVFIAPWEHAEDTALAQIQAMEAGEPREDYNTAPDPVSMVEVVELAEDIIGIPAPRAVSPRVFSAHVRVMDVVERVSTPTKGLEAENLRFLAGNKIPVDNTKA